jgi:hypothetical protein
MITHNPEHRRISIENNRLEEFISKVLRDKGESPNVVAENAHRYACEVERLFRADETQPAAKEAAATRCGALLEERLLEEIEWEYGTPTERHLQLVLQALREPSRS